MSRLSMPLLYSMLGEPFIVTLIFFMSGKMYFSESLVPAVYGSTNSNSKPLIDRFCVLCFTFILVSVCFLKIDHIITVHMVVGKLFASNVNVFCQFSKGFCSPLFRWNIADHFILKLDVGQLAFQLGCAEPFTTCSAPARVTSNTRSS